MKEIKITHKQFKIGNIKENKNQPNQDDTFIKINKINILMVYKLQMRKKYKVINKYKSNKRFNKAKTMINNINLLAEPKKIQKKSINQN